MCSNVAETTLLSLTEISLAAKVLRFQFFAVSSWDVTGGACFAMLLNFHRLVMLVTQVRATLKKLLFLMVFFQHILFSG